VGTATIFKVSMLYTQSKLQ